MAIVVCAISPNSVYFVAYYVKAVEDRTKISEIENTGRSMFSAVCHVWRYSQGITKEMS